MHCTSNILTEALNAHVNCQMSRDGVFCNALWSSKRSLMHRLVWPSFTQRRTNEKWHTPRFLNMELTYSSAVFLHCGYSSEHSLTLVRNIRSLYGAERATWMSNFLADLLKLWNNCDYPGISWSIQCKFVCFNHTPRNGIRITLAFNLTTWWPKLCFINHMQARLFRGCFWRCLVLLALSELKKRVELLFLLSAHTPNRHEQDLTPRLS